MLQQVSIPSTRTFIFEEFRQLLGVDGMVLAITPDDIPDAWGFYHKDKSNTMFTIERLDGEYIVSMDSLATYDDYRFFPYLIDSLNIYLCDTPYLKDDETAYTLFDEDWIEESIGEEIAYLKCLLSIGIKYYIQLPTRDDSPYITEHILNEYGVTLHSSTPRIYGYIWHLLKNVLLPSDTEQDDIMIDDIEVDVPQHESIGTVRSWQTDGAETTESYSLEDAEHLLSLSKAYKEGKHIAGVVLNDIGTIHEYGIGTERNADAAIYWYEEAIRQGDHLYAPTSLGDIYRRGLDHIRPDLSLALVSYRQSEDPYSWYRIGQSYEEGWVSPPDMKTAMLWYKKAAAVGHHLALKRLESEDDMEN